MEPPPAHGDLLRIFDGRDSEVTVFVHGVVGPWRVK